LLRESSLLSAAEQSRDDVVVDLAARFDDVEVLRWPDDDARRRELAAADVPCLLVVAAELHPPDVLEFTEDWIREPIDLDELLARHAALLQRVGCADHAPVLDDDGLLWWGDQWVAVPDAQIPVVRLLVARVRQLVRRDELLAAYAAEGGSANPVALKAMLGRLVKRFATVGLDLRAIRGRGYLLDAPNTCPLHAVPVADP
jgi:DNA-binding response OmpR family regulator